MSNTSVDDTLKRFKREREERQNKEIANKEVMFRTNIAAIEELLIAAKKTQSSSEGYAFRAIGWALHTIAIDLHSITKQFTSCNQKGEE